MDWCQSLAFWWVFLVNEVIKAITQNNFRYKQDVTFVAIANYCDEKKAYIGDGVHQICYKHKIS